MKKKLNEFCFSKGADKFVKNVTLDFSVWWILIGFKAMLKNEF